jgi:transcriptional regulator with XRE-family HTH domain
MSQQELAERSGLSVRTVSDLERGRTRFPYQDSLQDPGELGDDIWESGAELTAFLAGLRAARTASLG